MRGNPPAADDANSELASIFWASLDSAINASGHVLSSGYVFDQPAVGFTGFTFNVSTYAGLRELHDRAFEELRAKLYAAYSEHAERGTLDNGPEGLAEISPGLAQAFSSFGSVPDPVIQRFIPFQFHIVASATAMSRDEFIAHALGEAEKLRNAILADDNASSALATLAADRVLWGELYLAALEDSGLLRPEGDVPPLREHPRIVSTVATLTTGILAGPSGEEFKTGDLIAFFEHVRSWYGNSPGLKAPIEGINDAGNLIPAVSEFADFDLGLSQQTQFETFRVYVPWVKFEARNALPPEFQITEVPLSGGSEFADLDFNKYLSQEGQNTGLAAIVGPYTAESGVFMPAEVPLPYTVHFSE